MSIITELIKKIEEIQKQIKSIQDDCSHPKAAVETINKSNTGNYDPSDDSYWAENTCTLCEKYWISEQGWREKLEREKTKHTCDHPDCTGSK